MIFVTVGTHEQPFNRLIQKVDELKRDGIIKDDVIIQTGFSTYEPKYCQWSKLIPYQQMVKNVADVLHEKNLEVRQIIGTKNYWVQVVFWTIVVQMIACFGRVASAGGFMYAPCILYDLDGYYTGLRMLLGHMIETGLSSEERQEGIYFAKDLAEIKAILSR